MKTRILLWLGFLTATWPAFSQGTFVNLDFEASLLPTNGQGGVSVSAAFPGWSIYRGNVLQTGTGLNAIGGAQSGISLWANALSSRPLSGNFNAYFYSDTRNPIEVALAQTGQIPAGAGSLQFRTSFTGPAFPEASFFVSFGGTTLSLQPVSQGFPYTLWTADISAFAGTTGELRFTGLPAGAPWDFRLDDITFSPVPEPGTWALLALGSALFACAARRRRNH